MKNLRRFLLTLAVLAANAGLASALTITDLNEYGFESLGQIVQDETGYTDEFNIVTPGGYNPATQEVTSATATFSIWDADMPGGGSEQVRIDLGSSSDWITQNNFSLALVLSSGLELSLLADLNVDGIISYRLRQAQSGSGTLSYYLEQAELVAQVAELPVPDGGTTLAMLGLGLIGLGALRRKLSA